jgi:hypothetical protein
MQVLSQLDCCITEMDGVHEGELMVTAKFEPQQPMVTILGYSYPFTRTNTVQFYENGQSVEILTPPWML